jgi:predicted nucleotidyltransferase
MFTPTSANPIIQKYISLCAERNIFFQKVILFGSVARNQATEDSDIDVLFVSDQFTDNPLLNARLVAPVSAKLYDIEPHLYPTAAFLRNDPFVQEITQTGIAIC